MTRFLTPRALLLGAALALPSGALADQVTLALTTAMATFDPNNTTTVGIDLSVISNIYPALILRGPDMKLVPSLATSWKAVDDTTWRFTLVPDAKFVDGEPIDAETVKWNIERVLSKDKPTPFAAWFGQVSAVTVISPTEVEMKTSTPYPALPAQLSMLFLLPPKWAASHDPSHEYTSGGPYIVEEYVPGDHVSLRANPDYFGPKPAFDKATYRFIPETNAAVSALLAGEVDYIVKIPADAIAQINDSGKAKAGAVPSIRSVFIKYNTEKPPFDNKLFRQALNYAVDKESIVDVLFKGEAVQSTCQVMTPDYFGYNPDLKNYPYDPEKAKDLIKKSGVDLSQPIEFDVPTTSYLQGEEVAQAVAQMFGEVGVKTTMRNMDFASYMNKYRKAHDLAPLSLLGQAWPTIDADGLLTLFKPGSPYSYWDNKEFAAALAAGNATTDETKRRAAYSEATKVMCDEAPVAFLYAQPATYAHSNRVTATPRGDDWIRAFDMKPAQ